MSTTDKQARQKTTFAQPKGKEYVTKEDAESKLKKKFLQRVAATAVAQKKFLTIGTSKPSKGVIKRETHATRVTFGLSQPVKEYTSKMDEDQCQEAKALEQHLISLSPFNGRWDVRKTLSAGSYGVAFLVEDSKQTHTKAVIKVARVGTGSTGNSVAEWESFVLEKMFKADPEANVVRLLDKGMLQDLDDNRLEFMAVELCEMMVADFIADNSGVMDRKYRVLRVALGSFKGVYDLHKQGLLHRDIKPDNMGMIRSGGQYVCVLFDLGMARMYTDGFGDLRPPRTVVTFRGTPEWASGHAAKGRDQSRFDDLIAWLYCIIELLDPNPNQDDMQPFPWDFVPNNKKGMDYMKTIYAPARLLLKLCPLEFHTIYTYLMCANRLKVPDYKFIASQVRDAMMEYKTKADIERKGMTGKHKTGRTQQEQDEWF